MTLLLPGELLRGESDTERYEACRMYLSQADHCLMLTMKEGMSLFLQECKRHRPNGCAEVYKTLQCPVCLILPCLIILQKISNHLELLKGKHQPFELQLSPSAC